MTGGGGHSGGPSGRWILVTLARWSEDQTEAVAERDFLIRTLAGLPPRQRTVLVLRYYNDLSEAEIADLLGCSVGTVKSQASRGLARLRCSATPDAAVPGAEPTGGIRRRSL